MDGHAQIIMSLAVAAVGMNDYVDIYGTDSMSKDRWARFELSKNEILSRADWDFATVRSDISYNVSVKGYLRPLDCQRIIRLTNNNCDKSLPYKEFANIDDNQLYIKCTCAHYIIYVSNAISVKSWSPLCAEALIANIASHIAFSAGRVNQAALMTQRYENLYKNALIVNGNNMNQNLKLGWHDC